MAWYPDYDEQAAMRNASNTQAAFRALLETNAERNLYISEKRDLVLINKALSGISRDFEFELSRNYPIASHLKKIDAILGGQNHQGQPSESAIAMQNALIGSLRLDRNQISQTLTGRLAPQHDPENDAAAILKSPMFESRLKELDHEKTWVKKIERLSGNNLAAMQEDISKYKKDPEMARFSELIDNFMRDVDRRYEEGIVTHATNNKVEDRLYCTSDRMIIDGISKSISGDNRSSEKLSHTAQTNANQIQTHDYVFFNIYPKTNPEIENRMMLSTRYLREKPEVQGSPYAADGRSFSFGLTAFMERNATPPTLVALRDPVYPAGGTNSDDARKRMEHGNVATYIDCLDKGVAKRKFGDVLDVYETHRNVFAGRDIAFALRMNVELGLYKTFHGLYQADKKSLNSDSAREFYVTLDAAVKAKDSPEKDRMVMDIIKIYQYPQLLVSGSVSVEEAALFRPSREMIDQSRQSMPRPEESKEKQKETPSEPNSKPQKSAPSKVALIQLNIENNRETLKSTLGDNRKDPLVKMPGNTDKIIKLVDEQSKQHGEITSISLAKSKLSITFADETSFEVTPATLNKPQQKK